MSHSEVSVREVSTSDAFAERESQQQRREEPRAAAATANHWIAAIALQQLLIIGIVTWLAYTCASRNLPRP